jgi:hypothetical protein
MATRSADFPSLCRKVQAMKKKVHEQKARPSVQGSHDAHPDESSVGTVAAPTASALAHHADADQSESASIDVDIARAV